MGRGVATTPKGYVVVDKSVRGQLPSRTWERIRTRINELFQNAGGVQVVYLATLNDLPYLNLTDSVVECFLNSTAASESFRRIVYNRLNGLGHRIPAARALASTFNQPSNYSVDAGRSFTVKGIFHVAPYVPQLVCIAYGVVSLATAFEVWRGFFGEKKETTLSTIGSAPEAEQLSLGITLGNLIAHELRHQLALSKTGLGLDHSGSGLGMNKADFKDSTNKFSNSDEEKISANLAQLRLVQGRHEASLL